MSYISLIFDLVSFCWKAAQAYASTSEGAAELARIEADFVALEGQQTPPNPTPTGQTPASTYIRK